MYKNEKTYISNNYSKEDFIQLQLTQYSTDEVWESAIEIFEDRIYGRYLLVIDEILKLNDFTNAFSAMAIMCLLIETLYQFQNGIDESRERLSNRSYRGLSKTAFCKFLSKSQYFNNQFTQNTAGVFYNDIRCGILHQAQTKRGSQLTIESEANLVIEIPHGIRVNVLLFRDSLKNEYYHYIESLRDRNNEMLRINFITKMNFIAYKMEQFDYVQNEY